MANFFTQLFSSGATNLVDAVGNAIDKNVTSDEERLELQNELSQAKMKFDTDMASLDADVRKAILSDIDSARVNQAAIQTSEHASWLSKNVSSILALGIVILTFYLFFWIITGKSKLLNDPQLQNIVIYILGALTTVSTQVVSYYFGSSMGSKDKQKSLSDIAAKIGGKGG